MSKASLALALLITSAALPGADWIFTQGSNNQSTYGTYGGQEAADDFTLSASIEKVRVYGYLPGQNLTTLQGVLVRFHASAAGAPGAIQAEYTVPAGDPRIVFSNNGMATFEVTLPTPFNATGTHFLSVQILAEPWS